MIIKRHGIIKYLFVDGIYPLMKHIITGQERRLTNVEEWNKIAFANKHSEMQKIVYDKIITSKDYKTSDDEEDALYSTGWKKINPSNNQGDWKKEAFKIGD